MSDSKSELHGTVMNIVHELEAAASGTLYLIGDNCEIIDDIENWKKEQHRKMADEFRKENPEDKFCPDDVGLDTYEEWMEIEIGTPDDVDEPDAVSVIEYIERNSLGDVRFEVDGDLDLEGGKVLFCYGGPNIWVHDDCVCGYWGCDTVEISLDSEVRGEIYAWLEEMWEMKKELISR